VSHRRKLAVENEDTHEPPA